MAVRALPPSVLTQIFTNLPPSSPDLARVLLVSKAFNKLAKPILYRHVILSTMKQRWALRDMSKANQSLVKHFTIVGDGPIYDFEYHVGQWVEPGTCSMHAEWVEDLLTGKLMNITELETLHLRNVHEHPDSSLPWKPLRNMKVASNLTEVSIWNHQGSSIMWKAFLPKKCPNLRRLATSGVTKWSREVVEYDSQGLHSYTLPDESPAYFGQDVPYTPSNLEIIVLDAKPDLSNLKKLSPEVTLVNLSLDGDHSPTVFTKCQNLRLIRPRPTYDFESSETIEPKEEEVIQKLSSVLDQISNSMDQKAKKLKGIVKFLSIPSKPANDSDIVAKVEIIKSKGIEVSIEDEDKSAKSTSLFLPDFVDFLERNGKLGEK
ncbi:hypothetical protein JCM3765_007168 [Sporobolomyces pararoseus]